MNVVIVIVMIITVYSAHGTRKHTVLLEHVSCDELQGGQGTTLGLKNVSSNFSTIIVLIYMQLRILPLNNNREPKSRGRGRCAYVLGFSHASKLIYVTIRCRS